jgi:hypothetical protein
MNLRRNRDPDSLGPRRVDSLRPIPTANRKDPLAQNVDAAGLFYCSTSLLATATLPRYCGGVLLDGTPCGPTGASPGFNLRQHPFTMSPCGKLTCAE